MEDALLSRHYITLFMILLFLIRLLSERSEENREVHFFRLTAICCFLLVLEDQLEIYAWENPNLRFLRTFLSVAGYILRSSASYCLVKVVIAPEYNHWHLWIPNLLNALVCCTAFFTDLVFGFDENYGFYRGPLGYVPFVVPALYLMMIVWFTFRKYNKYNGPYSRVLLSTCAVFCMLSALLDAMMGGVRLHAAIMISSIFFYTFLQSYNQKQREAEKKRLYLLENIDRAIAEGWIQVYYQPIVSSENEKVCDEEALARWLDPVEGFLSPADFISALEEAGLVYKLDLFVLEQVVKKMRDRMNAGLEVVPQSINLSRSDFESCDIVEEIRKRVDEAGIARNLISVEITEGIIGTNFEFMKEQITSFQKLGFKVWMDDFGSGYSSLNVLHSISFDLIKFDQSFTKKLTDGERGRIILRDMMKMAESLHVDTICEGVETREQAVFLKEIGCSKQQGYYYGKPHPLEVQAPAPQIAVS